MEKMINHIFISDSSWAHPKIKYRRHRLVEYLKQHGDTNEIIWVYPVSASPRKPKSYLKAIQLMKKNPFINEAELKEWALPDFVPGRYMKFKNSFVNLYINNLKEYINSFEGKKVIWFTYPNLPYITKIMEWDLIVYDCSDLWTEPSGGSRSKNLSSKLSKNLIYNAEKNIINDSSIIFTSSEFLGKRIQSLSSKEPIVIENGVDLYYFSNKGQSENELLEEVPHPRLGYMGAMRSKIDFLLLDKIADENHNWNIVLVGPDCLNKKEDFQKLSQRSNVYWIGEVAPETVPDYISCFDVGLLPYREIEYNKGVFPIKFYEYLSQGVPVVGCGIPSTEKYVQKGIYLHVERSKFMEACKEALSWQDYQSIDYKEKRIQLAYSASWERKIEGMVKILNEEL